MHKPIETQVVEFAIGAEIFAVPVTLVREILDYAEPYHVPNGPGYFLGLTDVRGQGVPTVDFRRRLGLPGVEPTLATRILILDLPRGQGVLTLGVVIDRVLGVTGLEARAIESAPDIGVRWDSDYITGIVRREGGFLVIVDIARIFTEQDTGFALPDDAFEFP
ncbi:chemotaxis protein CheW [Novosphingobium sp. 1949]|uniref:Chemotaxis protein CheW n=1 Tax=Novosphingobium organovorum TaxID=2930092 RepID=A0ABT0BGI6_9SPHN|nr:chemotaxis protein CheW [Novosphingobium organovorum]MCJ2183963.1 chemotaxis protein CheW [Novosphingobium organovorum]